MIFDGAIWWVGVSIRHRVKSVLPPTDLFWAHVAYSWPFFANMTSSKKTGSTSRIATLSVDGRTTVIRARTVTSMQVLCVVPYRLQAWLTWPISNVTEKNPNRLNRSISVCGAALVGRELVWTGCRSVRITVWTVPGRGASPPPAMHESHNLLVA